MTLFKAGSFLKTLFIIITLHTQGTDQQKEQIKEELVLCFILFMSGKQAITSVLKQRLKRKRDEDK